MDRICEKTKELPKLSKNGWILIPNSNQQDVWRGQQSWLSVSRQSGLEFTNIENKKQALRFIRSSWIIISDVNSNRNLYEISYMKNDLKLDSVLEEEDPDKKLV